ncbi:MAG: glycoside hydrolase family 25 protein [Bacteroidota bacterium]
MKYSLFIFVALLGFSSCEEQTHRMLAYDVHGIDVSHYQSDIDWEKIAEQSVHFAYMKATEGKTHVDSRYHINWEESKAAGIKRGAYHFFRPATPSLEQANNFIEAVALQAGDLPPVLDVEVLDGMSKIELIIALRLWLKHVELHYGVRPVLYTYQKFYNKYLAGHFDEYPIWIARYNSRRPMLADRTNWHFWQYGQKGRLEGINGDVDFNIFQGSMQELEELCIPAFADAQQQQLAGILH